IENRYQSADCCTQHSAAWYLSYDRRLSSKKFKKAIAINQNNMTIFLRTDTKKTSETANIKSFQIAKVLTFCKF
ncbi:hypothetical protein AAV97_08630, partial [Acinetobacter sp. Ag2]